MRYRKTLPEDFYLRGMNREAIGMNEVCLEWVFR